MVNGATKPRRKKKTISNNVKTETVIKSKVKPVIRKRVKKLKAPNELEGFPSRVKKVANPSNYAIEDMEIDDINTPISFDITANIPTMEDLANFGKDKRLGFNIENMLLDAKSSMGSIFENLTNDNKTFGSKMDSVLSLQMLALLPTIQNLDDTMYDERKAQAAEKLNNTINHLKNSLAQKQQFELKEEIDLHHPKLQRAFSFLTEAFFYVLTEVGIDSSTKALIINALSLKTMGLEDELNKRFKGVGFAMLEQIENPLLEGLPSEKQMERLQDLDKLQRERKAKEEDFEEADIIPERD